MPLKIVLTHLHSFRNSGDAALAKETIQQLKTQFPKADIHLVITDPQSYSGPEPTSESLITWFKSTDAKGRSRWHCLALVSLPALTLLVTLGYRFFGKLWLWMLPKRCRPTIHALLNADLVVCTAGGYLYSSGRWGLTLLLHLFTMAIPLLGKKPLYLLPQSIGPLRRPWESWLLRRVLDHARLIMVRDSQSQHLLRAAKITSPAVHHLPDLAFAISKSPSNEAVRWLRENGGRDPAEGRRCLGITVIHWGAQNPAFHEQDSYETALASVARHFIIHHCGEVFFFTQVHGPTPDQDDTIPTQRVIQRLSDLSDRIHLIPPPPSPEITKAVYSQMDLFIASRMHSAIFALSSRVPTLLITYQPKTLGLAQMLDLTSWAMPIDCLSPAILANRLDDLWEARETIRQELQIRIPRLVRQAKRAGALLADDYRGLLAK
jgi:colanic acid/amylovoran biosynthesis protein